MMKQIDVLKTILVLALAALIFHLIWEVKGLLWLSTGLLVIALKKNPLADLLAKLWLKLSEYIGNFMSKIILSIIFFLLLTPLAMLYRLFNRDMTKSFFERSMLSTFQKAAVPGRNSYENPW
jgi:hypothetical protein